MITRQPFIQPGLFLSLIAGLVVLCSYAPAALAQARTAISIWRTHATLAARHILDARVVRERAIATLRDHVPELLQPGLFDRRVERQDLVAQRLASEHVDECGRRIAALEHACALSVPSPRLLLILAPKH